LTLGSEYRDLYIGQYQLLPQDNILPEDIWIRSTDVPRTIQSVQANLWNFFPPQNGTNGKINVIDIHTMDIDVDDMTPNSNICPALITRTAQLMNTSQYAAWNASANKLINIIAKVYNTTADNLPDVGGLWDAFGARMCHQKYIPDAIPYQTLLDIEAAAGAELDYLWSDPEYGRLGSGILLNEINGRILDYINGQLAPKLVFYSGHDSTVGPLMGTLGFTNGWPPYASHVEIELWSDSNSHFFVQVKYNGQSYKLPGCSGYMCPLSQFEGFISTRIPTTPKECGL